MSQTLVLKSFMEMKIVANPPRAFNLFTSREVSMFYSHSANDKTRNSQALANFNPATEKKIRTFTTIHSKLCFRLAVVNLQQNVVSFSTSP